MFLSLDDLQRFQWRINFNVMKSTLSKNGETFTSKVFPVKGYDKLWFSFTLKTDVRDKENNKFAWIYFNCFTGYEEVKADLKFDVRCGSENIQKKMEYNFTTSGSEGFQLFDHETLLGLNSAFLRVICKTKFTVKSFSSVNCFLGKKLLNSEQKDMKIIVGENEIMVHKTVLETFSPIFKKIIEASDDDAKIEITDCDFKIVKNAINFCYGIRDSIPSDIEALISYLQFSNKYEMNDLKTEIEFELIPKISKENICKLANAAIQSNATCLTSVCQSKLKEFINNANTILAGIEELDEAFGKEVRQNLCVNQGFIRMTENMALVFMLISVVVYLFISMIPFFILHLFGFL